MRLVATLALVLALAGCPPSRRAAYVKRPLPRDAYAHYLRAKVAVFENDYTLAVHELRAAAAAAPDEAMIAVALSDALLKAGESEAAAAVTRAAERRWPDEPEVWLGAGELFQDEGQLDIARGAFARAVELDRTDERGYLGLASVWIALREPKKAQAVWIALLGEVPDSIEGHFRLAIQLQGRGDDRGAEPHLRKVIELDPDHLDARLALAHGLRTIGKLDQAIEQTRQAFDRSGQDGAIAEELFWLLCERDDRGAALDLLGLLDDDSAPLDTQLGLVRLYLAIDELPLARRVAAAAVAANADSGDAAVAFALVLRATGEVDAAIKSAETVAATDPSYPAARSLIAEVAVERGHPDTALATARSARRDHPRDAQLAAAEAEALGAGGDDAGGETVLADLYKIRAREPTVALAYAGYQERHGRIESAITILDALLADRPNHVGALNLAGYLRADSNRDLARAQRDLARARKLAPGDPAVLDSWGWVLFRQGKLDAAAKALGRAVGLAPRQAEILFHLGEVLAATGDTAGARKVLEQARGLSPTPVIRQRIDARLAALGK